MFPDITIDSIDYDHTSNYTRMPNMIDDTLR